MVASINDHTAQVKHASILILTAKAPKKNHGLIKVENVSIQIQDTFIFSCLLITQSQNALTASPAYVIPFCPKGHHSAFASYINSQFCLQLEKRTHRHHQFCGNLHFGQFCSMW